MIVFTSAKSRLMMPGMVMMSLMPCTAWRRISSAMRNASKKLVPCSTHSISRSLGITMTVSTQPISSPSACSACCKRRLPSNANGFVTTATVRAPSSLARFATTGAAPLPVPPPNPAVTNTMSAPSSASRILSVSSSAALRPISGFAPAPSPLVSFVPSWSLSGACDILSACKSVLAATNSTPSTLARIMRFTALQPPPPTPMTLIFAPFCGSSLNETRSPASFGIIPPPLKIPPLKSSCSIPRKKTFQLFRPTAGTLRRVTARTRSIEHQADGSRVLGLRNPFGDFAQTARRSQSHRQRKYFLREFDEAAEPRASAGEHNSRGNLGIESRAAQILADHGQKFVGARLDNFAQISREHGSRRPVANAANFDGRIRAHDFAPCAGVLALRALGFGNRRAQSDGKIVREMVAADGDRRGVPHDASGKNNQLRSATANVEQTTTKLALVLREACFGGREWLEHCIADDYAGLVHRIHDILRRGCGRSDDVNVRFQSLAHHSDGVANVILRVDVKFLRQDVKNFAIVRQADVFRGFDSAAHIVAMNIARALAQRDSAATVHSTNMAAGDPDERRFDRDAHDVLRLLDGTANGADGKFEIHNLSLAPAFRFGSTQRREFHSAALFLDFADQRARFRAADVEAHNVAVLFPQTSLPQSCVSRVTTLVRCPACRGATRLRMRRGSPPRMCNLSLDDRSQFWFCVSHQFFARG